MIAIIDYDAGNIRSVEKALLALGQDVTVTADRDEILHADELAFALLKYVMREYPGLIGKRYEIEETQDSYETLAQICVSRKCFLKGEEPDMIRAAKMVTEDFRSGRIGRITLERPEEWN